jgi:hypothetical protein
MTLRWLAYALLIFGFVSIGYACTSDGESEEFIKVLRTLPENKQTEVQLETLIGFQIDGLIEPASLTTKTFFLTDGDGVIVPSSVGVAEEQDTAELIPDQPLRVITNYTVTLTTGLRSMDGRTLEAEFDWEFTTLDSEWGTSEWLEQVATGTSSQAEIVVDGQSNALAVWVYTEDTGSGIWANRYTRTDLWGEPELISAGDEASSPQLTADDDGNGFAVWAQREASVDSNIWTNRYAVDDGWGGPELLQEGEVTPARIPSIAADPAGNAIAVWAQRDVDVSATEFVWSRRFEPGTGWGTPKSIDDGTTRGLAGTRTAVGMDDDGNATAVWGRGSFVLWSNRYTAAAGWGTAEAIKADTGSLVREQRLAVGANGDAFVVWVQDNRDEIPPPEPADIRDDIYATRFSGGAWDAEPTRIDNHDGNKKEPDVAVDGTGVAHAVWSQADPDFENFENIWANQYSPGPGSRWGTPQLVEPANDDPNEDGSATTPRVGVNTAGNTFVVWRQNSDDWGSIWSNRIDPGEDWTPANAELIEDIDRAAKRPVVAVDDDRHAHAVWLHFVVPSVDWVRTNRFE